MASKPPSQQTARIYRSNLVVVTDSLQLPYSSPARCLEVTPLASLRYLDRRAAGEEFW